MQRIYPWIVWLLGATFFFYKYLVQVSPSVMTHDLMQVFHVHGVGLGHLSACYFYAYLVMQIPVGMLLDRYSPRYLTTFAIFLCGVSTVVFSMTSHIAIASVMRALMGLGAAFAAVSCFKSASLWFSSKRFAFISGMYMTAAMMGAVFGQAPLSCLVEAEGWRMALRVVGGSGLILAIVYGCVIRDKRMEVPRQQISPFSLSFKKILKHRQAWLLSIYSGLAFAPVSVFGGLWGVPFLKAAYHVSSQEAAWCISWIFIGFAIGAPWLGLCSDRLGRRKPIMLMGTWCACFSLCAVIYGWVHTLFSMSVFMFIFGLGASGFFISFAMIRELFPWYLTATVLGFMNTFDSLCEAISEPFVGMFLDWTWKGVSDHGVPLFSVEGYRWSLSLLPIYLGVACVILIFIRETYCKREDEHESSECSRN